MLILIKLLLIHFVGDFVLQPASWVQDKENRKAKSIFLYIHVFLHGMLTYLVLWNIHQWPIAISITLLHYLIDLTKLYVQREDTKAKWFLADQVLHLLSIFAIWAFFFKAEINLQSLFTAPHTWLFMTAILFITEVTGILIRELLSSWSKALQDNNDESLNDAGKYIGMLERLFVFVFVITGNWEGIGFLLAAKSVFRFGDLKESKDRKLTEYILIGTLLSFGMAIAVGMLVLKLTNHV